MLVGSQRKTTEERMKNKRLFVICQDREGKDQIVMVLPITISSQTEIIRRELAVCLLWVKRTRMDNCSDGTLLISPPPITVASAAPA